MTELESWDGLWQNVQDVVVDDMDREIWRNLAQHLCFQGRSVLELGCGRGVLSRFAAAAGARGITLVDNSAEALRVARGLFEGVSSVRFVHRDLLEYREAARSDIVLSSGTVEHFEGERLRQCLRVHRDHARERVVIVVPTAPHPNTLIAKTRRFRDTYGYEKPISRQRMGSLLRDVGLRPLVLHRFHPLYNMTVRWLALRTGLRTLDSVLDRGARRVQGIGRRLGVHQFSIPAMRRFDDRLGGLLLAVAAPQTAPNPVRSRGR